MSRVMTPEQWEAHRRMYGRDPKAIQARAQQRPLIDVNEALDCPGPVPSKYGNEKTAGYDSKREADRAFALRLMQEAGQIRNLREQVRFELIPPQYQDGRCIERACAYFVDFVYDELDRGQWRTVAEDAKGYRTEVYRLKKKLMLQVHGIRVRET